MITIMPRILNKYKDGIPRGSIYIGRPSPFGNPFEIGRDGTREEVIEKFTSWIYGHPDLMARVKSELRGKDLVCFCHPRPCHGDVLLKIANEEDVQ
jgi:hypothetical protein